MDIEKIKQILNLSVLEEEDFYVILHNDDLLIEIDDPDKSTEWEKYEVLADVKDGLQRLNTICPFGVRQYGYGEEDAVISDLQEFLTKKDEIIERRKNGLDYCTD